INPSKTYREEKQVPNIVSAGARTKPITVSQPPVITKKNVNSDVNGLSSTGLDNTKTRRPQPRSNTKNDRVLSASKSSRSKNKEVKVEEYHRNLLLSKKNKHISSACNNSKIDSQDVISKVVCIVCKKCLLSINHDECLVNYVNGKNSCGTRKSLATPKPRKPRFLLRWSPTGKMFDQDGKLVAPSNSESHVDCSNGDNACTSNAMEPKIKRFPNSTSLLGRLSRFVCGASTQVNNMACEEYSQEVLSFSDVIASGNPTLYYDPIVSTSSLTLNPFGDSDFLLEEVDAFLALEDDQTSPEVDHSYFDPEGDILLLEEFFNDDPSLSPPNQGNYLPKFVRNLKFVKLKPINLQLRSLPRYVVPTGRVIVPTGRYVVPADISFCKQESLLCLACDYTSYSPSLTGSKDLSRVGFNKCVYNKAINTQQQLNIQPQIITTISNNKAKFPYLKKDEYEVWAMEMEYEITNNHMNIWKVIQNGNNMKRTERDRDGRIIILPPTTAEEHIAMMQEIYGMQSKLEGLHKGYDRTQKILSQLNQLKAKPEDEAINLKFLRALPSSWSQDALTLNTKGGLELLSFDDLYYKLKTLEVDVKRYTTFSSSQSAGPSHSAFVSATSASKKMSYGDSLNYSSNTTYSVPSNSKTGSHRSGNAIEEGAAKIYKLITGADTEEANTAGDAGEFALMGVTSEISENELGWDDSAFSVFTTNSEDVEGRPIFHMFAKTDSMKAVPPPLSGDYTSLSYHIDLDESQMCYGTKSSTSCDSKSVSNDFISCEDSDKYLEVNTNDFASSDSSVKSSEHQPNDSTSCASTSSVSTSVNEAEIESNVETPIKEPNIVQDLPSFTCNSSDKNEHTSRTSCNKNGYFNKKAGHFRKHASSVSKLCFVCGSGTHLIKDYDFYEKQIPNKTVGRVKIPPARPQPVPTGKPKVFTIVPTGWPNRPFPVPTDIGYSPSVILGNHIEKVYTRYPRTIMDLIHLHTDANVADLLTKAFDGPRVFNSPVLCLLRVAMVINSPWIMPILGTKELASPEQTAPVATGRYVVPIVIVPTGRYVVPTGRVIVATDRIRIKLVKDEDMHEIN
nr:reverse transcriptase domain-containing protein [Tanacetum cinerariifolium]